jgi:histidinol-phosphate aminotransferase
MLPQPKPGILDIAPYQAGKSKAAGAKTDKIIKLSSNETPLGASPRAMAAYVLHTGKLSRYPDPSHVELREAISEAHNIKPEFIVCGAGSDELIGLLVHAYAGPGDEVLYSEHGFLMYKIYTQANGATPVTAKEKNLRTDVDAMLKAVTDKTKILLLANPNNPTGSYIAAAELRRLRAGLPEHVLLVVDAAYAEYVLAEDYADGRMLVESTGNTVMLRTFSKIYGLPSLRLGWCYAPAAVADVLNRIRGPFNVSGAAIAAGIEAMHDQEHIGTARQHNDHWLAWLAGELEKLGLKPYPSVANFILVEFPKKGKTSGAANAWLTERGIIVREVGNYGLPECLRITVGLKEENEALVNALKAFMAA